MKTTGKLIILIFIFLALAASAYAADDSPLVAAVRKGDKAAVEALLAKGADVNARNTKGETPLHVAGYHGQKDVAELLLTKGADVNAKDAFGKTPLHSAAIEGKDVAELLLTKGVDVNAKDESGGTPLHLAAFFGRKDVAELLLTKGADVNAKDAYGGTPLHVAAAQGQKDVAELLLTKGADVNAKDKFGKTPLLRSESQGRKDVAELLGEYMLKQARANPRAALVQLTTQFKDNPNDGDTRLDHGYNRRASRSLIIKLASELKPAPAIPEEARKHFVEGTAIVKAAKNPAQQALAAQSFTEALKIAPWWGDAYYNLGVAQELAEKYDEAEQAFNFYLLSNPSETEKREVQDRIYGLSAKRKLSGAK
ncbi:MAG: ankyrin repeat domain-containing protein [Desulfuromonadaceae bacterium]